MNDSGYWSMSYNPRYGRGWWLSDLLDSDGLHIDARVFGRGERLARPGGLTLPLYPFGQQQCQPRLPLWTAIQRPGRATDLSLGDSGAPVVSGRLGEVFREHAAGDIELLPLAIGEGSDPDHFVLNIARLIDAIDRERSTIDYWLDHPLPEMVGKPVYVSKLLIRADAAAGVACFRPSDWSGTLIVSSDLMEAIHGLAAPEIEFEQV